MPIIRSVVLAVLVMVNSVAHSQSEPPPVYDLRNVGGQDYVTSVKDQQGGTCWTHGTMASMESNLLMSGIWTAAGETGEPNLAEYHLDWWNGFNQFNNDDVGGESSEGLVVHWGGDYQVSSAYLTRGEGAVRDIDGQFYTNPPARWLPHFHRYYAHDIEWYSVGEDYSNIQLIKHKLMEHGAIATCMLIDNDLIDENYIHYQPPEHHTAPDHAVTIIGWSDLIVTPAPEPGAWLCKNSFGGGWGYNGYFWISYFDKNCGANYMMGAVSFIGVGLFPYDRAYYHDYHGWRQTIDTIHTGFNAFQAESTELLRAVSLFTTVDSTSVEVSIYREFDGVSLTELVREQSGFYAHRGFHTVDLNEPLPLNTGDSFNVRVNTNGGGQAYDCSSSISLLLGSSQRSWVPSIASPGESYYLYGGDWIDLTTYDSSANLCIKALADPAMSWSCSASLGWAPLTVAFDCQAIMEVDDIFWKFSDGGTVPGDTATYCFEDPGVYDVTIGLIVEADTFSFVNHRSVAAIADTMWADSVTFDSGQTVEVPVSIVNHMSLDDIRIPVCFPGDLALDPTSVSLSTDGCRTENFQIIEIVNLDPVRKRLTFRLATVDESAILAPGSGPIAILEFAIDGQPIAGNDTPVDLSGYGVNTPRFGGHLGHYVAATRPGQIDYSGCCSDMRGNIDGDPEDQINIADLVWLVSYMFQDGPPPPCLDEANINADPDGTLDIADLVYLVNYMFQSGQSPAPCL